MAATITPGTGLPAGNPQGSGVGIVAAAVLKVGKGNIGKIVCLGAGTLTINDCAALGAAATANQIYTGAVTASQIVDLSGFPYFLGLCISVMPAQIAIAFN